MVSMPQVLQWKTSGGDLGSSSEPAVRSRPLAGASLSSASSGMAAGADELAEKRWLSRRLGLQGSKPRHLTSACAHHAF